MKKFNKILHPEIALGLRGDPHAKEHYRILHETVRYSPEKGYSSNIQNPKVRALYEMIPSLQEDMLITWKFKEERPPVYQIGREFLKAMSKIEKAIPVDLLPDRTFAYFSFPESFITDEDGAFVQGVYVFIGHPRETCLHPDYWGDCKKVLWAVYHTQDGECARICMDLNEAKTFTELSKDLPLDPGAKGTNAKIFSVAMNLALYINSVDPDLMLAPPVKDLKPAEKKQRQAKGETINQCLLPVMFVSWNYHHPERVYLKDGTFVDTYQRWQRCGPGLTQVKLIWVKEHERKFKNVEKAVQEVSLEKIDES